MTKIVIVGQTNVGKTLFLLNFADYVGLRRLEIIFRLPQGGSHRRLFSLSEAEEFLTNRDRHATRCLQTIYVKIPWKKGSKKVEFTDTAGLSDGIHPDEQIRKAMAQALRMVFRADMILHLVDCSRVPFILTEIDRQLLALGRQHSFYCVLANKMDLPSARDGLAQLKEEIGSFCPVIPISAVSRLGFGEVRKYVQGNL